MSFAFVFPGQGSQSIGMLAALSQTDPVVRATFEEAPPPWATTFGSSYRTGPKERLDSTECTQPAMLAAGVATWRLWRERGGSGPDHGVRTQPRRIHRVCLCGRHRFRHRSRPGPISRAGDAGSRAGRPGGHGGDPRSRG